VYTASYGLKCGTQLLKVETDKIIFMLINRTRSSDRLALISNENEEVRQLDLGELVNKFSNIKTRRKAF
jgi:hypothetical protein